MAKKKPNFKIDGFLHEGKDGGIELDGTCPQCKNQTTMSLALLEEVGWVKLTCPTCGYSQPFKVDTLKTIQPPKRQIN